MRPTRPLGIVALTLALASLAAAQKAPVWDVALTAQTGQETAFMANPGGGFCGVPVELADYNGDGVIDYAVAPILGDGGPGESRNSSGVIHVFHGNNAVSGVLDVANLPAGQPLATIWGAAADDLLGTEIFSADLNDDGVADLILGASGADPNGIDRAGAVYVLWGGPQFGGTVDLASPPSWVTTFQGQDVADRLGFWVEAGDVNGDGIDDLLMSADDGNGINNTVSDRGEAHVVFGGQTFPAVIDMANPPAGLNYITVYGEDNADQLGSCMHSVDLDGDGFEELIVSAALNRAVGGFTGAGIAGGDGPNNNRNGCGDTYIIWGAANLPSVINLNTDKTALLAANALTVVYGANSGDYLGEEISSGDIDGDGYDDLLIGAITADGENNNAPNAGEAVILWGGPQLRGQTYDMATFPAGTSTLWGEQPGDIGGDTLSVADVNKDGFADVYFSEPSGDPQTSVGTRLGAGEIVILFGGPTRFPSAMGVTAMADSTRWPSRRIWGTDANDLMGYSMEGGDLNQDGFAEIFPNSMRGDGFNNAYNDAGEVAIVDGRVFSEGIVTLTTTASIGTTVGFHLVGRPNHAFLAGFALSITPPIVVPGVGTIHLALDDILMFSLTGVSPFTDLTGTTGADGVGQYTQALPNVPAIIGLELFTSFVTVDPMTNQLGTIGHTTSFVLTN